MEKYSESFQGELSKTDHPTLDKLNNLGSV